MRYVYAIAVVCILAAGCGQQTQPPDLAEIGMKYTKADALLSEIELNKGNRLYHKKGSTTPFTGLAVEFFEDGSRKQESYFLNGNLHGPQIKWYHNGDLFSISIHEDTVPKYTKEYGPDASINK